LPLRAAQSGETILVVEDEPLILAFVAEELTTIGYRVLTATNAGPAATNGVVVKDTLPSQVAFVDASATQGGCLQAGGVVTCDLGGLAKGATASVQIKVTAVTQGTALNMATVSSANTDRAPSNNSASASTDIVNRAPVASDDVAGAPSMTAVAIDVYSLISWRGEWYVVHLGSVGGGDRGG